MRKAVTAQGGAAELYARIKDRIPFDVFDGAPGQLAPSAASSAPGSTIAARLSDHSRSD